jgi:carbonic anhydrase
VAPSILLARRDGLTTVNEFVARHVDETAARVVQRSTAIAERVAAGSLAVVGATYHLADGQVERRDGVGGVSD